jgi:ATP-dependent protease HslVU (ClpYQ) ATPase subunit
VDLESLKAGGLVRILTEPDGSLRPRHRALLATGGIKVEFAPDGVPHRQDHRLRQPVHQEHRSTPTHTLP